MKCAFCGSKDCHDGKDCFDGEANPRPYLSEQDKKIWHCASGIEAEGYMRLTRLEEIIEFAKRMDYKKIGVAFCIGLQEEAEVVCRILEQHFEVCSVCCKACGLDKDEMGMKKIRPDQAESACNPVGQAQLLNREKTELNIIVGLCVGHDVLFTKHAQAPVTTLVAKDRVLAHNPVGAIYSRYYRKNRFGL